MSNRNNVIDCFRALAVIMVSFYHVYRHINPELYFFGVNLYNPLLNGWMGVGIFFVVSGYCMGMATKKISKTIFSFRDYWDYFKKRLFRISGPYYVSIAFWFVMINVFAIAVKPTETYDVLMHLFYTHNLDRDTMYSVSGVYWSLAVEMQFYVLLPLLIFIFPRSSSKFGLFLVLCGISTIIHFKYNETVIVSWSILAYLPVFVFGWLLYINQRKLSIYLGNIYSCLIFFIISFALVMIDSKLILGNILYESISSLIFGLLMISIITSPFCGVFNASKTLGFISYIGRASFSIYLYNYIYLVFGFPNQETHGYLLVIAMVIFGIAMYNSIEKPYEYVRKNILMKSNSTHVVKS
ncbi:acyltransferase family protein [Yersinia enterocolitica]|uniref:acyltransferase family protein n=1 Tax=Yersinia TaxID=629 RepID=UPI003AB3443B